LYKKILSSVLVFGIVCTMSSQVLADPLQDNLNSAKDKYNQNQSNLSDAQKKQSQLEGNIEILDNQIEKNIEELDNLKIKIGAAQASIGDTEKSIESSDVEIKKEKAVYNAIMRSMYINGVSGYIEVLFDSKNLSDFLSRAEIVERVTQADNKIITHLNQQENELQDKKNTIAKDKESLVAMQNDSNVKLLDLSQKEAQEKPMVAQAQNAVSLLTNETASQKAEIDAINKQIRDAQVAKVAKVAQQTVQVKQQTSVNKGQAIPTQTAAPAPTQTSPPPQTSGQTQKSGQTPTPVQSTGGNQDLISYAESFEGVPYVYGGSTPSGFDCSGFTSYVFRHFGVDLLRTSEEQWGLGTSVSESDLEPGDLLFFEMASDGPGHVGIYIGNGLMIHAPHTGASVEVIPFTDNWGYCGARRVR
jgi:cell wall-associated NlpC family hydrolase